MNTSTDKQGRMKHATATLRYMKPRPLSIVIVGMLTALATAPVMASDVQGADTAAAQQNQGQTGTDSKNKDNVTKLGTITVTANKRTENVQQVASSISVLEAGQLEKLQATQLTDYANYVPGFQVSSGGTPGQATVSMRGIAPLSSGSTVGTYIDDTPLGSSGLYQQAVTFALDLLPYDVDHIEILRGPQGTLYGAGSMGGLVKYVMKQPDLQETEFRAGGGVSSVKQGGTGNDVRLGFNLPLVENSLGLRAGYSRNKIPGYIDNSVTGEKDINSGSQSSARVALLWRGDSADVKLSAMRQTIDSDNDASVSLRTDALRPIGKDLSHQLWVNEPFKKTINYYAATIDWDLGWADFSSASGYSKTVTDQITDQTVAYGNFTDLALGLPDPGSSYFDAGLFLKRFTQEFRLTSKTDTSFEWMLGAFYSHERGNYSQAIYLNQLDGSPLPAPFGDAFGTLAYLELPSLYIEKALFAHGTYKFTDRFKLGAGVRYSKNRQKFSQNVSAGALLPIADEPGDSREGVFTWSLSPQFQMTPDSMVYAKVATGYQPGGPNVSFPGLPPKVDSSTLTSYEVGMKGLFADRRAQVDLAAYRIDWKDIQVPTSFEGKNGLVNGGTATTQGLELATMYIPNADLQFGFNAAYTKASLSEDYETIFIPSPPNVVELTTGLNGDRLPYVPKFSASFTGDYYFPVGSWEGNIGGGMRWTGDRTAGTTERQVITDDGNPPTVLATVITPPSKLDSYYALDLHAGVMNDHWSIRAYVKNATDERAYSSIGDALNQVTGVVESRTATPIRPRTVGLEFDYRF